MNGWGGSLILEGGLGNDSYVFVGEMSTSVRIVEVANADSDTLDFSAVTLFGGAGLTVDLEQTTAQEVTGGLLVTLFSSEGIENVVGSNAADTMSGNSRDNVFRGLSGQDTIDGRGTAPTRSSRPSDWSTSSSAIRASSAPASIRSVTSRS